MASSTLSYLINFMRCTIIVNQHSISFAGLFVILLSMLFRGISNLLLTASLIHLFQEHISSALFLPLIYFTFHIIVGTLFNLKKRLPINLVSYWTTIAGKKSYMRCFHGPLSKKKFFQKFNLMKLKWLKLIIVKLVVYISYLVKVKLKLDVGALFNFLLTGFVCEVFSHISRLLYFKFCHVWKDILPVKANQKRKLKIFDTKLEIVKNETESDQFLV